MDSSSPRQFDIDALKARIQSDRDFSPTESDRELLTYIVDALSEFCLSDGDDVASVVVQRDEEIAPEKTDEELLAGVRAYFPEVFSDTDAVENVGEGAFVHLRRLFNEGVEGDADDEADETDEDDDEDDEDDDDDDDDGDGDEDDDEGGEGDEDDDEDEESYSERHAGYSLSFEDGQMWVSIPCVYYCTPE